MVAVVSTTSVNYFRAINEIIKYRSQDHLVFPLLNASSGIEVTQAAKLILMLHPDTFFGMFAKTLNKAIESHEDLKKIVTHLDQYLPEFYNNPHLTPENDNQLRQGLNRSILKVIEVLEMKTDKCLFVGEDCIFNTIYGRGEFDDPIFSAFGGLTKSVKDRNTLYVLSTAELARALCDPIPYNPATGEPFNYTDSVTLKQNMSLQLALAKYSM